MSCSSGFVFKGVLHRRFKFKKCSVWLPWGKINPLIYNIFWLYNFRVFDTIKSVTFRKSWGHILELYAKAKSSLISQHVQFFKKKCKKTYNFRSPCIGGVQLSLSCRATTRRQFSFFFFHQVRGVSDICLIDQGSLSQLENPAPKPLGHSL